MPRQAAGPPRLGEAGTAIRAAKVADRAREEARGVVAAGDPPGASRAPAGVPPPGGARAPAVIPLARAQMPRRRTRAHPPTPTPAATRAGRTQAGPERV